MNEIRVFYIGWKAADMTIEAAQALLGDAAVILRTGACGGAEYLKEQGKAFQTLDALYEACEDFDLLDQQIEEEVCAQAENNAVCYATASLPDRAAARILRKYPQARGDLSLYAMDPCCRVSASAWESFHPDARIDTLVTEITDRLLASEIKLKLMETYADETQIFFRLPDGRILRDVLSNLDRMEDYDHRAAALIAGGMPYLQRNGLDIQDLADIMAHLREQCPWDGEQTHESLRKYLIEEAYEAADAIDRADEADLCEELGDVLFQVVFHAQIGREYGEYELRDVIDGVCRKMLKRHRHVFGGVKAETSEEVAALWQQVKKEEKKYQDPAEAVLGVATAMPSLILAQKAAKRALENGVDMPEETDTLGSRLFSLAAGSREDAEGELRRFVLEWMQQIREGSGLNQNK